MSGLDTIARECLREAEGLLRTRGITVEEQIGGPAPGQPEPPAINRDQVKHAVCAMLEAAIARAAAGSRLRVTVKAGPQASMIAIKAPGQGIDPANSDEIVPPPAAQAAAAHGGRAWANGRVGRGVTFYLTLPVAPPRRATAL